jgi:hypothetical protein
MSLQHVNSVIDHYWPEYQRRFPAFEKPQIVPAESLRGMAPVYMRRNIDQDPSSYYLFVRANPMNGDSSRERMLEFVDDLFYNKLRMGSSYEQEGYSRDQAVNKEVLPAADDREFQSYYNQQMAAMEAQQREQERQRRKDDLGFDPDDPDIIDIDVDDNVAGSASDNRAVGAAASTAVGQPRQIWYAVDFHVPAGGMLGYDGNSGRLGGSGSGRNNRLGRGPRGYLREEDKDNQIKEAVSANPISDIVAAFQWARSQNLTDGMT